MISVHVHVNEWVSFYFKALTGFKRIFLSRYRILLIKCRSRMRYLAFHFCHLGFPFEHSPRLSTSTKITITVYKNTN